MKTIIDSVFYINTFHPKIHRFRSLPKNNPFAPYFDVVFFQDNIGLDLITELLEIVKQKETEGLFDNEQWTHYNVFMWDEPVVKKIKEGIKNSLQELNQALSINDDVNPHINGWIYPQKKNTQLRKHNHAVHQNSYISGTVCLTTNDVHTHYEIPYVSDQVGTFPTKSVAGSLALFPSCISHYTERLEENERYVLAFDIVTNQGMNTFREEVSHLNPEDPLNRAVVL